MTNPLPYVQHLPFQADVLDVLAEDFDQDGLVDVALMSHGKNKLQFFRQQTARQFIPGSESTLVGFHPGDLIRLTPDRPLYLLFAEGLNKLAVFEVTPDQQILVKSEHDEFSPRHGAVFHWPGWGLGIAVAPYQKDFLVLYKNVDPDHLEAAERVIVPLDTVHPSLRSVERPSVADIDGDGVDEILFATNSTHEVGMIRNPAKGQTLRPKGLAVFEKGRPSHLAVADLNDDGRTDLAVPDQTMPFSIHLLLNAGKGNFDASTPLAFPTQQGIRRIAAARDQDGFTYLLGASYDNLTLYQVPKKWDGKSAIPYRTVPLATPSAAFDLLLSDLDVDGALDAVLGDGDGAWIIHGPLWQHFSEMSEKQLVIH